MTYGEIYYYGILASIIGSLIALTFTKDKDCNIQQIGCIFAMIVFSGLSWLALIICILSEIRTK